jgi:hypothetical protein
VHLNCPQNMRESVVVMRRFLFRRDWRKLAASVFATVSWPSIANLDQRDYESVLLIMNLGFLMSGGHEHEACKR